MPLNSDDFTRLIAILEGWSGWKLERDRLDFMEETLRPSPRASDIMGQLDFGGNAHGSAVHTVTRLDRFGEDILGREVTCLLIDALKSRAGVSDRAKLDAIAARLNCPKMVIEPNKGDTPMLTPEQTAAGVVLLFEVARWAKSELSEFWKLRRKEKEIELSKQEQETVADKAELQSLLTEIASDFGDEYTQRVLNLISQNRDLYLAQDQRVATARDQFNQGNITAFVRDNIYTDAHNEKVLLLGEIQRLGANIGITKE